MKTFLQQFMASVHSDHGRNMNQVSTAEEVRHFGESMEIIASEFKSARTGAVVPPDLHESIMREVMRVDDEIVEPTGMLTRQFAVAAGTFAALAGVLWFMGQPAEISTGLSSALDASSVAAAFDRGHELAQTAPRLMLEPLSGEMEQINRDLESVVTFLVQSVP